jgi:hypothetical protein
MEGYRFTASDGRGSPPFTFQRRLHYRYYHVLTLVGEPTIKHLKLASQTRGMFYHVARDLSIVL